LAQSSNGVARRFEGEMKRTRLRLAAVGILFPSLIVPTFAGSVTQPGETVGAPSGAPAPPGFYFANKANWGCRNTSPQDTCVGIDIPVLAWSTPWTIFAARLQLFLVGIIPVEVGVHNTTYFSGLFNPFASAQLAWDLGNGWGFSYMIGGYFEVDSPVAYSSNSLNQRFALSYTSNGWNLTANVIWGIQFDQVTSRPQTSPCPVSLAFPSNGCNPNFINVDLTATKRFGKWELGPVGYYSSDLTTPVPEYRVQSQFAMGGLVGYWFGPVILQGYLTTDVYEKNYGGKDVRVWTRIVIPLGNPSGPSPGAHIAY
jgi:Putative MetA-pathway of phenol degradation